MRELRGERKARVKSELLERYATDYPKGPHDQPQSMCPAFGSLRVGLRMRRTATVLCGSACCVYGLTFTSHFYGARRTVGYVPFDSETLVTGKLFEDLREAVYKLADPEQVRRHRRDQPLRAHRLRRAAGLLPKEINGVRIIGIDVPGFGVPTHAEAKDVLAGAMLDYARNEAEQGPVQAPGWPQRAPTVTLVGEMFPVDAVMIGRCSSPWGSPPVRWCRRASGASSTPRSTGRRRGDAAPFYTAIRATVQAAGRPCRLRAGRPRRHRGLAGISVEPAGVGADGRCGQERPAAGDQAARSPPRRSTARITLSGYEGSELLVARLLIESRRQHALRRHRLPATAWSDATASGWRPAACRCNYRASLEQDIAAVERFAPDLAIGTTPVVQHAKELGSRAVLHQPDLRASR
jgi:chlorophyllide a reductase subunit Y